MPHNLGISPGESPKEDDMKKGLMTMAFVGGMAVLGMGCAVTTQP